MGTVLVLVLKECFKPNIDWLHFYNLMSGYVGVICWHVIAVNVQFVLERTDYLLRKTVSDYHLRLRILNR